MPSSRLKVKAAIQEERLTRVKRHRVYGAHPSLAVNYCLQAAGIEPSELALVVYSTQGRARASDQDINLNPRLQTGINRIPTLSIPHHTAHAVSAFATSGFEKSAILVVDGMGSPFEDLSFDEQEVADQKFSHGWESISYYTALGNTIFPIRKILVANGSWLTKRRRGMPFFGTLGGMYSAVSMQIFGDHMEAGKVMGLSAYGQPTTPASDFFRICRGELEFTDTVPSRFFHNRRWPQDKTEYRDLACSVQRAVEEAMLQLACDIGDATGEENLCLAGGVALNGLANEKISQSSRFENVYTIPAADDSGIALGAGFYGLWYLAGKHEVRPLRLDSFGTCQSLDSTTIPPGICVAESSDIYSDAVSSLVAGEVLGWFQDGSELGPRALGHRSILADPRNPDIQQIINETVKFREPFRPYAQPFVASKSADFPAAFAHASSRVRFSYT